MLLKDKKGLILGVANKHSIAWAIAQSAAREGAQIAFTFQPDDKGALERRVRDLAADLGPLNIRVNAISAGPIKTLSASGISDFTSILEHMRNRAPMRRNVEREEVGEAALFFLSNLSSAVTGDVLFVDCGYHIM